MVTRPRRKGASPLFPIIISKEAPTERLLSSTIQGSILLQNYIRYEVSTRLDPALIIEQGWASFVPTTSDGDMESVLRDCINLFKTTTKYETMLKMAEEASQSALEEASMHRLMMIAFSDAGPDNLAQQTAVVFSFCTEVGICLLATDRNNVRFQEFLTYSMHYLNGFLAEKICDAGGWQEVFTPSTLPTQLTSAKNYNALYLISGGLCIGAFLLGYMIISSRKPDH